MRRPETIIALLLLLILGCTKEDVNPFDDPNLQPPDPPVLVDTLDPTSFEGLHYQIFKPTCSNSGCHDGTFEPDFRTIESSYNTLVYHGLIKNNPSNDFLYRVLPMKPDSSVLMARLLYDIDGQSGLMPILTDPNSDWPDNKDMHIANIRSWIENGAPDMFGDLPTKASRAPKMVGCMATLAGSSSPIAREPNNGRILVPNGTSSINLWFAFEDDQTPSDQLTVNELKICENPFFNYTIFDENLTIVSSPISGPGFYGDTVSYTHRVTIDPGSYGPLTSYYHFRTYVQDDTNPVEEFPADGSYERFRKYFSYRFD
jgi:hypothetical protein